MQRNGGRTRGGGSSGRGNRGRGGYRGRGRGRGGSERGRGPPSNGFAPSNGARGAPRGSSEPAISLDESFTMEIHAALQALVEDGERTEMSFPSSYDNTQRRYIHSMAQKYGLFSKSSGKKGAGRFIHVAKVKKNAAMEEVSLRLPATTLSASTVEWFPPVVREYMDRYPPPMMEGATDPWSAKDLSPLVSVPKRHQGRGGSSLFKPLPSQSKGTGVKVVRTPPVEATKLPVYGYREQILELVERNQIVVLSGDTGCGKSTQIPQFLLDDALARGRGEDTRIICTQPRRISAISLAERVARERTGQDPKEVGHAIRFDSSFDAKRSKLIFCTTGTLLKWLNNDPLARGFSHIILDEVHERDQFTDFLLILIKTSILKQRPDLKVILMSATIQVEKFSQYFQPDFPAPVLQMVGGTNFPVTTLFLEDVLALLESDRSSPLPIMDNSRVGRIGGGPSSQVAAAAANNRLECPLCGGASFADEEAFGMHVATCFGEPSEDFGVSSVPEPEIAAAAVPVAAMGDVLQATLNEIRDDAKEAMLSSYMAQQDALRQDQAVDYDLLLQLLFLINRTFPLDKDGKGAILVFLPGWEEISFMERTLLNSPTTAATYEIALLHSRLSAQEQRRAFMIPPHGKRKLVLATNIAETSLTIEDVVFVVDCGKSKQTHALAATSSSSFVMGLQTTWVARANCVQRTGRAGRVRAGICFRLFSKSRYETAMKQFMLPELLTTPLEELLLQIKLLQFEKKLHIRDAKEFLLEAMDAPSETSIDASLQRLGDMRALADTGRDHQALTLLGWHLGHICTGGVSVQMAKLLLWGHTFGCFDAIVQTTCTLSGYRDPFISFLGMSPEEQRQVDASKKAFARNGSPPNLTLQSDHFVLWKAFEAYLDARARASFKAKDAFCARNKLHRQTLDQLVSIYKQLQQDMDLVGLSPETQLVATPVARMPATVESVAPYLMALSIGMYPNALFTRSGGVSRNWTSKEKVKVKMDGTSMVAWQAANSQKHKRKHGSDRDEVGPPDEWLVYHEMMQSERTRLAKYGTKLPSPLLQALFMGSVETQVVEQHEVEVEDSDGSATLSKWLLVLDDWIVYELDSAVEARWLALLRQRLHATFIRHLERLHANAQHSGGARTLSEVDLQLRQHDAELLHALVSWVSLDLRRSALASIISQHTVQPLSRTMRLHYLVSVAIVISIATSEVFSTVSTTKVSAHTVRDTDDGTSRILRTRNVGDSDDEERAGGGISVPVTEKLAALFKSSKVTDEQLQKWLDIGTSADTVFYRMKLANARIRIFSNPQFSKWVQYADDLSAITSGKGTSAISTLTAQYGDDQLYLMLTAAKTDSSSKELASRLLTDQLERWITIGKDPVKVYKLYDLQYAFSGLLRDPQFSAWAKDVDNLNAKQEGAVSMIPTLRKFYSDADLFKMAEATKSVDELESVGLKLENAFIPFWINDKQTPAKVLTELRLKATAKTLESPLFGLLAKFTDAYNVQFPKTKTTMIETLTHTFGDDKVAKMLAAVKPNDWKAKTIATELEVAQLQMWLSSGKSVDDVYNLLNMPYIRDSLNNFGGDPPFTTWIAYMNTFSIENPDKVSRLFSTMATQFTERPMMQILQAAEKFPSMESVVVTLQPQKAEKLFATGISPSKVFTTVALDNVGDAVLSSPLFTKWMSYVEEFNKKNPTKEESWFLSLRVYYSLDRLIESARKTPKTAKIDMVESEQMKDWLIKQKPPKHVFHFLNLKEAAEKALSSPNFELWVKYLNGFNQKYPGEKTTMIDSIRANYQDLHLIPILNEAAKVRSTEKLAKNLQNALIDKWIDEKVTARYLKGIGHVPSAKTMIERYTKKINKLARRMF